MKKLDVEGVDWFDLPRIGTSGGLWTRLWKFGSYKMEELLDKLRN